MKNRAIPNTINDETVVVRGSLRHRNTPSSLSSSSSSSSSPSSSSSSVHVVASVATRSLARGFLTRSLLRGSFYDDDDDDAAQQQQQQQQPEAAAARNNNKNNNDKDDGDDDVTKQVVSSSVVVVVVEEEEEEEDENKKQQFRHHQDPPQQEQEPLQNEHEEEEEEWYQRMRDDAPRPWAATRAECQRFYYGNNCHIETALQHLEEYLEWRKLYSEYFVDGRDDEHKLELENDRADWETAWTVAWDRATTHHRGDFFPTAATTTSKRGKPPQQPKINVNKLQRVPVPQYIYTYYTNNHTNATAASETTTTTQQQQQDSRSSSSPAIPSSSSSFQKLLALQILPAKINLHHAPAPLHTLAVAMYLQAKFSRHDRQQPQPRGQSAVQVDLLLDVRGSPGWPNPTPFQSVPLIRMLSHLLVPQFPGRLHQLIIFPLPSWAVRIYHLIHRALPAVVQQRTLLVAETNHDEARMDDNMIVQVESLSRTVVDQMNRTRQERTTTTTTMT